MLNTSQTVIDRRGLVRSKTNSTFPSDRSVAASLSSPLRLRLVAELLDRSPDAMRLEDAVLTSGRHRQDILACLKPMERQGLIVWAQRGESFALAPRLPERLRAVMVEAITRRGDQLARERRVRWDVLTGMVGLDDKMLMVFEMIRQVARLDVPVLITGETGTGKELVARAIHELSPRREHFLGAINCAAIPDELFASEMFGHVRGAFTGAVRDNPGVVGRCHQGSLFLDEIGDLSLSNQIKLLRVLQEKTFSRLGEAKVRSSDFRVISATHQSLSSAIREQRFREDLFYRLNVFPIRLPSLRERLGDMPYLVEEILKNRAHHDKHRPPPTITGAGLEHLKAHRWPGNVRELENVLQRASILAGAEPIDVKHLPSWHQTPTALPVVDQSAELKSLEAVERAHIEAVMKELKGNISAMARVLDISRTTLYTKLRRYNIPH